MNKECTFIIFGATGDLTKRKLVPALYKLMHDKKIDKLLVVGTALDEVPAVTIIDRGRDFISAIDEDVWRRLKEVTYYQPLNVNDTAAFKNLAEFVTSLEKKHGMRGNRIAYLAVPAHFFCAITEGLGQSGLIQHADNTDAVWQRIVYEKPFGFNKQSAEEINACITKYFTEKQIFRIDHYLTKELVGNIVLVRFTNMIFEPLWNNNYIEQIQIILNETIGMEGRGIYYDQYGVLKDVVQNHIMQLIALIAMELPQELVAKYIRDQKAAVLQQVKYTDGLLGQYRGYTQEKGVAHNSCTPTFAALKFAIDTKRWQGVPFFVKTGKCLHKKDVSIHIKFREVACKLRERCMYTSNYLSIQIAPEAIFSLQLNTKQPGATYEVTPVNLTFNQNYVFGAASPEAYEVLFEQVMLGEQSVSVRFDEIEYAWNVIEEIEKRKLPEYTYDSGSFGPLELETFNKKYAINWRA